MAPTVNHNINSDMMLIGVVKAVGRPQLRGGEGGGGAGGLHPLH